MDYGRSLRREFAGRLARFDWDIALLQEAPPRWRRELAFKTGAAGAVCKTSRNQLGFVRGFVADRRPDLIKSGEGGSNQVLFRPPWRLTDQRRLTLAWLPERRRMQWLRLEHGQGPAVCVANLHASAHKPARAAQELERAAETALQWSRGAPLILGGDFNVRPSEQPWIYEKLTALGFTAPTGEKLIDHLLGHGLEAATRARQLPAESREVRAGDVDRVRLSDHAVIAATFDLG